MQQYRRYQSAFSIPELLIIVIVIGVLSSISIVGYGAWRDNIAETQVRSDLQGVRAAMENEKNWSDDGYPQYPDGTEFDGTNDTSSVFVQSDGTQLTFYDAGSGLYCVQAQSVARESIVYYYDISAASPDILPGTCSGSTP